MTGIRRRPAPYLEGVILKNIWVVLIVLLLSCSSMVEKVAFFPDTRTIVPVAELPANCRLVNFDTDDGVKIQALYFEAPNDARPKRVIIYFHGNGGNMYGRIPAAQRLCTMGVDVFLVSYRGYAQSQGKPSEKGIYIDGRSAVKYVTQNLSYRIQDVFIYGRSLGTTVAVEVAQNAGIGGLILITPLSNGVDYAKALGYGCAGSLAHGTFDSLSKIPHVHCPLLVIHGTKDEIVPYNLGVKLFDAFHGEKKFVPIPDGGHNNLEVVNPELFWGSIKDFLKNH